MGRHIKIKGSSDLDLDLATYLNQSGEIDRSSYAALLSEVKRRLSDPSREPPSIAFESKHLAVIWALRKDLGYVSALRKRAIQDAGHGRYEDVPQVPSFAESVLRYVCSPKNAEAILGDLEEQFRAHAAKRGVSAAMVLLAVAPFSVHLRTSIVAVRR
jgi:hypothetical protein